MKLVIFALGNLLVLFKTLFFTKKLWEHSDVDFVWNRKFAQICAAYPLYFPYKIVAKRIFKHFPKLFNYISYKNINNRINENNNLIYVSLSYINYFQEKVLPKIHKDFNLVTGDSVIPPSKYLSLLDNKYLKNWFCQNCDITDHRVHPLPLGLDYHTIYSYPFWGSWRLSPERQEQQLNKIINKNPEKEVKIFSNFQFSLNSERRKELYKKLKDSEIFFFQKTPLSRLDTWKEQQKYSFVFSPKGVGMDCHRTYEALILGCIPIVESSFLDDFYKNFPIVIIKSIDELTIHNLEKWEKNYRLFFNQDLEEKLKNKYWIDIINNTIKNNN